MSVADSTLRCVLVDDSARVLDAARSLLEGQGIEVVGVASTSSDALRCVKELQPDVTLVDVDLGSESGIELAEELYRVAESSPPAVILISTEPDFGQLADGRCTLGFLPKYALSADAIVDILRGRADPAIGAVSLVSVPRGT